MTDMIALVVLAICAYTDIRERNIYMMPLMISSAGAVIMHLISVFSYEAAGRPEQIIGSICIPLLAGVLTIGVCRAAKRTSGTETGTFWHLFL